MTTASTTNAKQPGKCAALHALWNEQGEGERFRVRSPSNWLSRKAPARRPLGRSTSATRQAEAQPSA